MATTVRKSYLYDSDGRNISTYCEKCYDAPQEIAVKLATTSAPGIDPATTIAGFVVTCVWCNRTQEFVPGVPS